MNTPIKAKTGQAVIELVIGLVAVLILVSAFFYLARYMAKSLKIQNQLRSPSPVYAASIELDDFSRTEVFGMKNLHINEPHGTTDRTIR